MPWKEEFSCPTPGMPGRIRTIYWGRIYLTLGAFVVLFGGVAGIFKFIIFA